MAKHIAAKVMDIPSGARLSVEVQGRKIAIFNVAGEYFGLRDACPHMGGLLSEGVVIGLVEADRPGCYSYSRGGEIVRCPWHGWEFDLRTGKSRFDPNRWKTHSYDVEVGDAQQLEVETVDVTTEGEFVIVNL